MAHLERESERDTDDTQMKTPTYSLTKVDNHNAATTNMHRIVFGCWERGEEKERNGGCYTQDRNI
jgi:hypothetical protein